MNSKWIRPTSSLGIFEVAGVGLVGTVTPVSCGNEFENEAMVNNILNSAQNSTITAEQAANP